MSGTILEVKDLTKIYRTFKKEPGVMGAIRSFVNRQEIAIQAVKPSSFKINRGEFVGLLGPNGAGKTTILKMLTGLIPPTTGHAIAFGEYDTRLRLKPYLRRIGMVMGQRNQLHPDLPALDSFRLSQAIYNIEDVRFSNRLKTCLDLFEIQHKTDVPVRKLSLGERMKMELILAILHEPELLFLDEPTIGLDFNAAKQIRKFLLDANTKLGITTVLTSHYTKDIEELCRRVIVINQGTVFYDGALEGLDTRLKGERVVAIDAKNSDSRSKIDSWVRSQEYCHSIEELVDGQQIVRFSVLTPKITEVTKKLWQAFGPEEIADFTIEERNLEDIFSELYERTSNSIR